MGKNQDFPSGILYRKFELKIFHFQGLLVLEDPFKTILDPATDGKGIMILGQVTKSLQSFPFPKKLKPCALLFYQN